MKKVLFIGVSFYDLRKAESLYLREKFEGLSREIRPYVLARGRPFCKKMWGTEFYLLPNRLVYWLVACKLAFWLCLIKRIDTIVAQSPLTEGFIGAFLKKILGKELIVEIHGDWLEGPFLSKKRKFAWLQKKIVPVIAKISFRAADKIRGVANYLIERAKKIAPDKPYFVFPTFTDLTLFLDEKDVRFDNFILFVGQLEKVKGVRYLIEAFAGLANDFPDFKLVIIGEGSERKNFQFSDASIFNLAKRQLQDKIELKGKLSLEQTKDVMKNCYCLVLPSLSEGLPRVLLEAMALAKPVIGSRVGGIPEVIRDGQNGFLFEKGSVEDLAKKLKALLADRDLAVKMGERGRGLVQENFSNQRYIENYLKMLL